MDKNNISIVLPTLNEKKNLESLIPSIVDMLKNNNLNFEYEILVVDDGSTDGTSDYVNSLIRKSNCISFIERTKKKSLPLSIYEGIEKSKYSNVMWLDADGSMNAEAIKKLLEYYFSNTEITHAVVGSRFTEGGGYKGVKDTQNQSILQSIQNVKESNDSVLGMILSIMINKLLSFLFRSNLTDLTSGFIVLRKELIDKEVFLNKDYGEYFIYLLGSLIKKNIPIDEVGYICETRMYGVSKTGSGIITFTRRGIPYIIAAMKRGRIN
jgi:glycosyltransferase involved in cell wall biosynthesis